MSISGISGMGMPSYVNSITSQRAENAISTFGSHSTPFKSPSATSATVV